MSTSPRPIPPVRRLVVKIGSAVIADDGRLDHGALARIADDASAAMRRDIEVILVSSGAVASGFRLLGLESKPKTIVQKQAAAAVGQSRLMQGWSDAFARHVTPVAQALLTADDLDHRGRVLNARHTLLELTSRAVVPIVNENDTVSFDEIKLGDNDRLSALVASLVRADLLLILSSARGLYDGGDAARVIPVVPDASEAMGHVRAEQTNVGTGGMQTKLEAAAIATAAGVGVVVAGGAEPNVIARVLAGEALGTWFPPGVKGLDARKRWIGFSAKARGALIVDDGAERAILHKGASLLPSGVREATGDFARGAPIEVRTLKGEVIARGLAAYSADECRRIAGRKSAEIADILGYVYGEEVIHRNDMVALTRGKGAPA